MRIGRTAVAQAGLLAIAGVLNSCCEEPSEPCNPSLAKGETYSIELLSHFEIGNLDPENTSPPYAGYRRNELSCDQLADLQEGSVLLFTAEEGVEPSQSPKCQGGCFNFAAKAAIEGISVEQELDRSPHWIGDEEFFTRFTALVHGTCRVRYDIGITRVLPSFMEQPVVPLQTNYLLFRSAQVEADSIEACAPFIDSDPMALCWDNWSVRVRKDNGEAISTDLTTSATSDGGS